MVNKIKLLEDADVYDINNFKSPPIFKLPAGTEADQVPILKGWKSWHKITLSDGREGLIPGIIKIQLLGSIVPKGGGWANFRKVLKDENPARLGFDMPDCIKSYEKEVVEAIRTDNDPARIIVHCSEAGAGRLLQKELIGENVIERLLKNALKLDAFSIKALIILQKVQQRKVISDTLLGLLAEKACNEKIEYYARYEYLSYLLSPELESNWTGLIPGILGAHRSIKKVSAVYFISLKNLWVATHDSRILDALISHLDEHFAVKDILKSTTFTTFYEKAIAWGAADELLDIGDPRGIREIIPGLLKYMALSYEFLLGNEKLQIYIPIKEWVVRHGDIFLPDLIKGIEHKEEYARLFVVNCLLEIGDSDGKKAIVKLKDDPKKIVRDYVRSLTNLLKEFDGSLDTAK
jgi:hypothetical protein